MSALGAAGRLLVWTVTYIPLELSILRMTFYYSSRREDVAGLDWSPA